MRIRKGGADIEVIYGNFGILVSIDKKITVRDYSTFRLDENQFEEPELNNFINDQTIDVIKSVYQRFSFSTSFGYPLKNAE